MTPQNRINIVPGILKSNLKAESRRSRKTRDLRHNSLPFDSRRQEYFQLPHTHWLQVSLRIGSAPIAADPAPNIDKQRLLQPKDEEGVCRPTQADQEKQLMKRLDQDARRTKLRKRHQDPHHGPRKDR